MIAMKTKKRKKILPIRDYDGFDAIDNRTRLSKALRRTYKRIVQELGGEESLSETKRIIAERFCFLAVSLKKIESEIIVAESRKSQAAALSRWVQGNNALIGMSKMLGLSNTPAAKPKLAVYLASKKREA